MQTLWLISPDLFRQGFQEAGGYSVPLRRPVQCVISNLGCALSVSSTLYSPRRCCQKLQNLSDASAPREPKVTVRSANARTREAVLPTESDAWSLAAASSRARSGGLSVLGECSSEANSEALARFRSLPCLVNFLLHSEPSRAPSAHHPWSFLALLSFWEGSEETA